MLRKSSLRVLQAINSNKVRSDSALSVAGSTAMHFENPSAQPSRPIGAVTVVSVSLKLYSQWLTQVCLLSGCCICHILAAMHFWSDGIIV